MYISQQIAAMAVADVLSGRNLTLALPDALDVFPKATPQQKGGAADLSYGTLRFYGEVNAYLTQLLEKPLSNTDINALLLVALYQLLHDQADDFTVVNQSVKAAGNAKPRWAKSLVNGVLRNFLRKKESLSTSIKTNDVALYSYPQWWINKLKQQYPDAWQAMLQAGNAHPPMTLRVNAKQSTAQAYVKLLTRKDITATALGSEAVMLSKPIPVEQITGFVDGMVSVQDYGAQLAAYLLDVKPSMRVLDACSAPGGKTGHLLELAALELTALDNDAKRLDRVASNLTRLHLQADLQLGDAGKWQTRQSFDRILADVPCTASGIVRRHVDIKWLRRESDIVSFTQQQAVILANLWHLLSKGGKLLYATCSVFAEENQQQIDRFLQLNTDAIQLPLALTDDRTENMTIQHGQLIPSSTHDGFFYALLQKS
ncbi:MAG: 16S rRNA (cytosine(967)-C(5))-methyltransferase RsmB [Methylophilaceae bacterium]|nr:16S rRNA (cytosine(967)-C(5))-methyltransferase RsmB [Methylophilaceae bacterium]MDG1454376.1 16S rRNA (cytosine(967)-C(5))-methyltransferase RsmB [Methylophilaceae bacterium]